MEAIGTVIVVLIGAVAFLILAFWALVFFGVALFALLVDLLLLPFTVAGFVKHLVGSAVSGLVPASRLARSRRVESGDIHWAFRLGRALATARRKIAALLS